MRIMFISYGEADERRHSNLLELLGKVQLYGMDSCTIYSDSLIVRFVVNT